MIPKFRAWNKVREEMIDDCDLSITSDGSVLAGDLNYDVESGMLADVTDNVVIMMSTRLKDAFGNELFEGDIFESRFSEIKYVVYWDDKLASFWIKGKTKTHPLYTLTPFQSRILGNIYENPELLEG